MKIDGYTKFILTVIALALILNAAAIFTSTFFAPVPVHASTGDIRITDFRTTWPIKVEITNWPREYTVKQR